MSEKEKDIMRKIANAIPKLEEAEQHYVLGVAEGMALMSDSKPDPPRKEQ